MKKKNVVCLLVVIICGFVLGEVVYSEYKRNLDQSSYNAYLIKIGYAGITTKLTNATKIKNIYDSENVQSVIIPTVINNVEFINNLEQYDLLLSEVDNKDNILSINDVIISNYEELILEK